MWFDVVGCYFVDNVTVVCPCLQVKPAAQASAVQGVADASASDVMSPTWAKAVPRNRGKGYDVGLGASGTPTATGGAAERGQDRSDRSTFSALSPRSAAPVSAREMLSPLAKVVKK